MLQRMGSTFIGCSIATATHASEYLDPTYEGAAVLLVTGFVLFFIDEMRS